MAKQIDVTQDPQLNRQYNSNYQEPSRVEPKSIKIPRFNWVPDKVDKRDYKYQIVPKTTVKRVDLRPYCSAIENQGQLGSCTGNSIAGAIEYLIKRNNRSVDVSRLFIYYYTRLLEGTVNYDSGAYIRDAIKAAYTWGAPDESLWPYNISRFKIKPSDLAITQAAKRKVTLYERISNFDGCINALDNGFPVTIGFYVYSSFDTAVVTRTGMMPYPNTAKERLLGGHAVLLVGYDKTTNRFIARNSWGTNWGDKGYFYMPFQVIQNRSMSADFWIIKTVKN